MVSDMLISRRAVILGATGMAACAVSPTQALTQLVAATPQATIRLGVFPIPDAAIPLLGLDRGVFARHGINLLPTTLSTASIVQSTISGQVDIAINSLQHSISAVAAGIPLVVVGGLSVWAKGVSGRDPDGLIVSKDGPKTGAGLNGKIVAVVALNSADELAARVTIDRHGGDSKTVKFTVLPPSAMKGAVLNGDVQAAVVHDPFYSSFMASNQFAAPFGNPNFQAFADLPRLVAISSKAFSVAHGDKIRAFQVAMLESIEIALAEPEAVATTMMKWFKTAEEDARASTLPKLRGTVTLEDVVAFTKISEKYNFIRGTVDPAGMVFK